MSRQKAETGFQRQTNPNSPLRLLSLDGGGVRGLSSLMVLDFLMDHIAHEEKRLGRRSRNDTSPLKPCDYFDLIGGTSTGGIIAILLGRLRLDCKQCIRIYSELAKEIFQKDHSIRIGRAKIPTKSNRFSGIVLEKAIKKALVSLGYSENEVMWDGSLFEEVPYTTKRDSIWGDVPKADSPESSKTLDSCPDQPCSSTPEHASTISSGLRPIRPADTGQSGPSTRNHCRRPTWRIRQRNNVHKKANQRGCRAFVVTSLKNALGLPRILPTYDPNDRQTRIWEALRATSAAPTFFEEMTFGTPRVTYLDGGVGFNNPCAEVDYAAKSLWEGRPIGCIVSIGTGLQTIPAVQKLRMTSWLPFGLGTDISLAAALASMATGTAYVDNQMERMYFGTDTRYYRFDVDGGLANVSLEQWMKEDEMTALTTQYMHDPSNLARARDLGEVMTKLSTLPPRIEVNSLAFRVGMAGNSVVSGAFKHESLDFKTGYPLGWKVTAQDMLNLANYRNSSPSGLGGLDVDKAGRLHKVYPVALDLDGDGRREESVVTTCDRANDICLRCIRTGFPPGKYRVKFIVSFLETDHAPPTELVFSVGKPFDAATFERRYVDVKITPDVVPVLLHPDAVRVRTGWQRYLEKKGKGWTEIEGDVPVQVGLDGTLGFIINKKFVEKEYTGGWSFGGVRLEPVFTDGD